MRLFRRHPATLFLLSSAVVLSLAAGCATTDATDSAQARPPTTPLPSANPALSGTITIGAVLPLTGANATVGTDQQRGIELAVAKINAGNGVLGKKLAVAVEDSQGQTTATIDAARKLVAVSTVPVVIGEYASGNTIPMQQFLQQSSVVGINVGSSSIELRGTGAMQFSTIGLDDKAGEFSANALYDKGFRKVAMLAPNNAYGSGIARSVADAFTGKGGQVVASELYTEGQPNYRQELARLANADPDVYVVTTYGRDGAAINAEMYELAMTSKPVFDIYMSQDVPDSDAKAVEGRTGMDVKSSVGGSEYETYYRQTYGEGFMTSFSGFAYDAVFLAALAIEKAGAPDAGKVAAAVPDVAVSYQGVTGPLAVGPDGQRLAQPYTLGTVRDGRIEFP
ncbi:MAG TPA: ABC transporter substrate-binding protein [Pseudonocardia sp.]|uniref:ABC transporter substrate-binding protein n=1 Tax=Pseudonocardia sp. TaxID=60912 RepID=UPI002BBDF729|nr:ABC transporter substrate-binding protein [Pseudonocardia sp.]HTF46696.1 ABC transporter substrate-binding protein [Pseudonocardia sp.]